MLLFPAYRRRRAEYIKLYRRGWELSHPYQGGGEWADICYSPMLAGFSARHNYMSSPLAEQVAELAGFSSGVVAVESEQEKVNA